jgi:HYR domain
MNGRHRKAALSPIVGAAVPDGRALTSACSHPLTGWRHVWLALALVGAWAFLATDAAAQIVAGPNANIGGGPACSRAEDPGCPFQVFGDVTIQRQNEGSMACSSRNPQTCLAAGNDYRLVGLPSVSDGDGKVTADAWLGIFWSRNGGQAWRSTLLPGWKTDDPAVKDTSPEGAPAVNPIAGFQAAADPTLRAGTHGLFYLSGIAFNRAEEANGTGSALAAGGEGKSGVQFASVFIDDNDSSNPNKPPRYLRTTIVDSGTSGRFLDKPWIIADIPRGLATCTIPAGPGGEPAAQTIQSGMVYIAYATFLGSGNNPHSDVWVKSSNDCGATWSNGAKLTASVPLNQSPIIVVNPVNGNLHVIWREFGQGGSADRILMASSTNAARTFGKVAEVTSLGVPQPLAVSWNWPANISTAFDQTTLPNPQINFARMARTNGYPSACVGTDGLLRIVFAKRIPQPGAPAGMPEFARIMFGTLNGSSWSIAAIDNHPGPGHQFQPALACTGTRATAIWYDQRSDAAFNYPLLPWVFFPFIVEPMMPPPTHTVDVRAVQTDASGVFQSGSSIQVSKYPLAYDTASQEFVQLQYNFLNFALFGGGQVPFLGDYLEVVPKNPFTPPLCANAACTQMTGWAFNTFANESPLVHGLWTDNRDVLQTDTDLALIDWTRYAAPGSAVCTPASLTWTRNQNLYTSLLGAGFVLQAEGNARRTKDLEKRAYVVQLQNLVPPAAGQNATLRKRFRLTFAALSGEASFSFATDFTSLSPAEFLAAYGRAANPVVNTIFVDLPYASGAVRSVFVRKDSTAPVVVIGEEVHAFASDGSPIPIDSCTLSSTPCSVLAGGAKSRVIIAPDPQAPVQVLTEESHDADFSLLPVLVPGSPAPVNSVTYSYPLISSSVVLNDPNFSNNLLNPTWTSPTWTSPTWTSPTWTSPTWTSPTWTSPTWTSPTWTSPTWTSQVITETSYLAQGTGSVTSGYDLDSLILSLPQGAIMQTLVSKVTSVPGTDTCTPGTQVILQPVANVTSLNGLSNTSFSLAPGEQAIVTLRVACDAANGACYTPSANTSVVLTKQAPDCTRSPELVNPDLERCEQPNPDRFDIFDTAPPTIAFSPAAPANVVQGTSPAGAVVPYSASASDPVDALLGISVAVACTRDGQPVPASSTTTLFGYGTTTITCTSTDSHGNTAVVNFTITVVDTLPPVVTVPGSVTLQATSPAGAVYTFSASATDNVDGTLTPSCTPVSGSTFPVGATTVTCTATDTAGNTGSKGFVVTVVDTVAPLLTVPANIVTLSDNGGPTATVTYTASATDFGQPVAVSCTSTAGTVNAFPATQLFPVGTTTVTCLANDGRGNTATGSFTVTVALTFGILGPLSPYQAPPKTYNNGSSVPIAWKYTIAGVAVASPFPAWQPQVRFVKVLNWRTCANSGTESTAPEDTLVNSATPGNSYFTYSSSTLTWKLNWDSPAQPNTCWNIYIGTVDRAPVSVGRLQLK